MKIQQAAKTATCLILLVFIVSQMAFAKPLSSRKAKHLEGHGPLREQMSMMILSIADLDILVNRDRVADYEIFIEDAERILKSVEKVREMDAYDVYEPFLKKLEKHSLKLKALSLKKDPRAMEVPEKIFNTCFRCHQQHRSY